MSPEDRQPPVPRPSATPPGGTDVAPRTVARVEGVGMTYGTGEGAVHAVRSVDLRIPEGSFTAVMGPSGSGKSTLMHIMAGLEVPTHGRVWIGGREITGLDDEALTVVRRRHVGFVFQAFNLMPAMDVMENIVLPFELDGRRPDGEESAWIEELVGRLGLAGRMRHRPGELSGGQQQRVAIARALAGRPELILADEPTGNLDSRSAREVLDLLRMASRDLGQSIAMVTHDPRAAAHADRVVYLADGGLVREDRGPLGADAIASAMISLEEGPHA